MTTAHTSYQYLGGVKVIVAYELIPGEPAEGPESRAAGPGSAASVVVTGVNIISACGFGEMVDSSNFNAALIAQWGSNIEEELAE